MTLPNPTPLPPNARIFQIATKQGLLQVVADKFYVDDGCLVLTVDGLPIAAFNSGDWDTIAEMTKP